MTPTFALPQHQVRLRYSVVWASERRRLLAALRPPPTFVVPARRGIRVGGGMNMKQLGAAVDFALHGEDYDDENFSFQVFLAHVYEHKDAVKASIKALIAAVYALVMYEAPLASLLACSFCQAARPLHPGTFHHAVMGSRGLLALTPLRSFAPHCPGCMLAPAAARFRALALVPLAIIAQPARDARQPASCTARLWPRGARRCGTVAWLPAAPRGRDATRPRRSDAGRSGGTPCRGSGGDSE